MKKRLFSLTLIAALCLSLFPVGLAPALAADRDTVYVGGVTLSGSTDSPAYATTDDNGTVTIVDASADKYNIKWDGSTLTLDGAKIKGGTSSESLYATVGIYAFSNSGDVSLNIALKGVNEIFKSSDGIWVYSSSYNAGAVTLTIEGEGSLNASGSSSGILVQSNNGNATLTIQNAEVTATSTVGVGVQVRSGAQKSASLTVDGGSLTATGMSEYGAGIRYTFGSSSFGSGTPSLTVSDSAIVKASGDTGGITSNSSPVTPSGTGIVFNNGTGTVYGDVTLQEDLEIGEDESLTIPDGASLTIGSGATLTNEGTVTNSGTLTNNGTINNSGILPSDIDGNEPPSITTISLSAGTVGTAYNETLEASGNPTSWEITDGSLSDGLTLAKNTGVISGNPSTSGTSTFTVTATNQGGSDSKQLTLTIEAATNVTVESVSLDKTTLELTENRTATLTATVLPDNATNKDVTWSSSDSTVATVDESGKVTAIAPGEATITVATVDGNHTATCTVTVTAQPSYSISATPSALNFGSIDDGQAAPAAQTVTITNTGNQRVTVNLPTSTNYTITAGTGFINGTATLEPDATATFTVQPKAGLGAGKYDDTLTISGSDSASAEIALTFTVNEPPYTGKYSYEIVSDVGENGTIDVDRYATEGDQVTITVSPDEAYLLDDLTVTSGGKDVALTDNGDGTYTFTMPSGDVAITATFAEDPNWEEPEAPATDVSEIFTDVPANHWAKAAIQYVYDNGLMTGVSDTTFAPEATTTRAMIVSMLARMENVTSAADAGFTDVAAGDWYATAVNWAAANGIVSGIGDNTFAPNAPITREQLAAMLMNYAQWKGQDISARADLSDYTDAPSTWASEAVQWAVAEGLLAGVTDDQLQPQGQATRAQVAAIMQRFLEA